MLRKQLVIRLPRKWWGKINLFIAPSTVIITIQYANGVNEESFCQIHHRLIVAKGLVYLKHRKFRVVFRTDALITVNAAQLKDPLHPTDQQPLQV